MSSNPEVQIEQEDKVLAIGKERVKLHAVLSKLHDDIRFLHDRINRMKQFRSPNKATLETYEEMLKSREAVLTWLEEQKTSTGGLSASGEKTQHSG